MYTQNRNPLDEVKSFFKRKSILSNLILINIAVFLAVNVINLLLWLFQVQSFSEAKFGVSPIVYWLSVPSDIGALLTRPWSIITYMFLQENFFHIFFNMFVLYFGGRIFMEYLSEKKLLSVYIWGGIAGAVLYILSFNAFPVFQEYVPHSIALGASASVLAILVAISTYVPNYTVMLIFFGRVKLKYLAIGLVVLDILSIQRGNPGGHIAHLGGALWGFAYIKLLQKGTDMGKWLPVFNFKKIISYFTKSSQKQYDTSSKPYERPMTDDEYNYHRKKKQVKIDAILEKISKSGYDSLSKEEKEILFKASNKK
ncbi:MAG: rhomboid family intramembrane serine protease [Bacteroidales bacterium]|nr:rhomboid family intramembrane serine protease [Bacteroidales bacterium]MCF8386629.1 rhomboid family intramembrane serine protease [Bacteroidales bacterium]MCF8398935.1 rhomboid family intramembrane serine protease [Bacteroidales bacterium]